MTPRASRTCREFGAGGASPLVALVSSSSLLLLHSSRYPGTPILFLFPTFLATPTDKSQLSMNSKLGMASWGLPWLIYPHSRNASWSIKGEGGGGSPLLVPVPLPKYHGTSFSLVPSLPWDLLFLYKNHRLISCFHTHR